MRKAQLDDMQRYLVEEFLEEYQEGHLSRRQALRQLTLITGSGAVAVGLLAACGGTAAAPTSVPTMTAATKPAATAAAVTTPAVTAGTTSAPAGGTTAPAATKPAAVTTPAAGTTPAAAAKPTVNPVTVQPTDPAITGAGMVEFAGPAGRLLGYLARPAGAGPHPLLIVVHENRGLTPHIQDVARRAAKAGYVALAPDLLSRAGGTEKFADPQQATGAIGQVKPEEAVDDLEATIAYLQGLEGAQQDRLGVIGFCWGGGQVWRIATESSAVKAATPFYGPPPPLDQVKNTKAAIFGVYAERDQRLNQSIPDLEKALKEANVTYQIKIYPGVNHAFHNDTGGSYNAEVAKQAWTDALAWLDKHLRT